jgi:hypothetical protein
MYYCYDDAKLMTKAGIFSYGGKWYYNNSGGGLAVNKPITVNYKHYYAGTDAAFRTSGFYWNGVYVRPDSRGEISFNDWNAVHGNQWAYYQYIHVSIGKQMLYYYLNGEKVVMCSVTTGTLHKSDPVTGQPYATQRGTYKLQRKLYKQSAKKGDQAITIDYWMNYNGNNRQMTIGDGPWWWNSYGGSTYKTNGSNGEVLIPFKSAQQLYNSVPVGTPIVID